MAMPIRFVDLFCGIGGFHHAMNEAAAKAGSEAECVLACDIDPAARASYFANFGVAPASDIRRIDADEVPDHDILLAGFPCQAFSIIGGMRGFADDRGTLFFEIRRILEAKRPEAFVLENVKQLRGHDKGRTLKHIEDVLREELGYQLRWEILDARDFGLPQKRERIVLVGFRERTPFEFPVGGIEMTPLRVLLEPNPPARHFASPAIQAKRRLQRQPDDEPTIWHENKSGNIGKHPYSCALRAGASHNYLLVDGIRRLTEREMLRLQGFPDSHLAVGSYSTVRRHAGNAVPVPMISAVLERVLQALARSQTAAEPSGPLRPSP